MSTYLLAVLVSNFKKVTQYTDKYKVLVEITARPDAIDANQTSYALNDAVKVIDFYSDYFNITYPLKKSSKPARPQLPSPLSSRVIDFASHAFLFLKLTEDFRTL